jgi:hypothetical protein
VGKGSIGRGLNRGRKICGRKILKTEEFGTQQCAGPIKTKLEPKAFCWLAIVSSFLKDAKAINFFVVLFSEPIKSRGVGGRKDDLISQIGKREVRRNI